jgi:periplasmic mercuric ion binding protein
MFNFVLKLATMKSSHFYKSIIAVLFFCFGISSTMAQKEMITSSFKVLGNCEMCQRTIETAARRAGAKTASWDKETKVLNIKFNASKVTEDSIQKAISLAGYDTPKYKTTEAEYNSLHFCCKYDRSHSLKD